MKVVLLAHTPPPHHGQSYMVELVLRGLGGDRAAAGAPPPTAGEIGWYHVNARLSDDVGDIGRARGGKLPRLVRHCARAIAHRVRHGAPHLYYVPAPGRRVAVYRDWLVMALCRPFFRTRTYHWHAAGLAGWLASEARGWERWLTRRLLGAPDLCIVLGEGGRADAAAVGGRTVVVVPNGIPDPEPDFADRLLHDRLARAAERRRRRHEAGAERAAGAPAPFRVLFLGLCVREKGLFDAVEAVALLDRRLRAAGTAIRVELQVAGLFPRADERAEFERRIAEPDLVRVGPDGAREPVVRYLGFVEGARKRRLLEESDCLCFPTYFHAESFGLVIAEAMAHGLPVVATEWRVVAELLPDGYDGLVPPRSPERVADALERALTATPFAALRARYAARFTVERMLTGVRDALLAVGGESRA